MIRRLLILALSALLLPAGCCQRGDQERKVVIWEQMDPAEQELLDAHLAAFRALNPEISVERVHYETEQLRTQFQNAGLAGAGPELVYGPGDQIGPFSIMGIIEALDGLFSDSELDSFAAGSLVRLPPPGAPDPLLWSLPDQVGNHLTLCINRALVSEVPADFDALIDEAKRHTVDEDGDGRPERYGLVFNQKEPFWLVPFLGAFGGWVMDDHSVPTLDSDAMRRALAYVAAMKHEHGVIPQECDYDTAEALFKEGKAAFLINGPWSWQGYIDAGIDLALAPMPPIPGAGWPTPMVSVKGYSLNSNSRGEARADALLLLRFLTGEWVQERLAAELGVIPSRLAAGAKAAASNPLVAPSRAQILRGRPMPVVSEMRAIWDTVRPEFQAVLGNAKSPEAAARAMQANALRKIAEMKGE